MSYRSFILAAAISTAVISLNNSSAFAQDWSMGGQAQQQAAMPAASQMQYPSYDSGTSSNGASNVYMAIAGEYFMPVDADGILADPSGLICGSGLCGLEVSFDQGWAGTVAVGSKLGSNIRVEGELGYRDYQDGDLKLDGISSGVSGDLKYYTIFANVIYDFETGSNFTPYAGAGLGLAIPDETNYTSLAYQAKLGVMYDMDEINHFYFGYKFLGINKPEQDLAAIASLEDIISHGAELGYLRAF